MYSNIEYITSQLNYAILCPLNNPFWYSYHDCALMLGINFEFWELGFLDKCATNRWHSIRIGKLGNNNGMSFPALVKIWNPNLGIDYFEFAI